MFVIRNVFHCKPGKAKALVEKFKAAAPHLEEMGIRKPTILTDTSADFWTVVLVSETESLDDYFTTVAERMRSEAVQAAMAGYMDLVTGGRREIFKVE